jgi:hypothetical protein
MSDGNENKRLIENNEVLNAEEIHALFLGKQLVTDDGGLGRIRQYVSGGGRGYTAMHSIFRA